MIGRHLKPCYGYVEQVEIDWSPRCDDGTLPRNAHILQWADELMEAMDSLGRPIRLESDVTKQRLADAGFVDIKEEAIRLPLSSWPTERHAGYVGRWFNLGICQACQPLSLAPLGRCHGRTPDVIYDLTKKVKAELDGNTVHAYCTL